MRLFLLAISFYVIGDVMASFGHVLPGLLIMAVTAVVYFAQCFWQDFFRGRGKGMPEVYFHGATIGGYSARELKQVHDRAKGL